MFLLTTVEKHRDQYWITGSRFSERTMLLISRPLACSVTLL